MSIAILLTVKNSAVQNPMMRTQICDMQKYLHPGLCTRKHNNGLSYEFICITAQALLFIKTVTRFKQVFYHKDEA